MNKNRFDLIFPINSQISQILPSSESSSAICVADGIVPSIPFESTLSSVNGAISDGADSCLL